jgi:hypothetical protein
VKHVDGRIPTLSAIIETRGRHGSDAWKAEIDIRNYVRASIFNIYGGIDIPRSWIGR